MLILQIHVLRDLLFLSFVGNNGSNFHPRINIDLKLIYCIFSATDQDLFNSKLQLQIYNIIVSYLH